MPIASSIANRQTPRGALSEPSPRLIERWNGVFRLLPSFRRVKARTEPAFFYTAYDDRRAMHALVDAYANVVLDVLVTKFATAYAQEELTSKSDEEVFVRQMVGWKLTFIGESQLAHISALLRSSKIEHRYSVDMIGRRVVDWFNDRQPLGSAISASIEHEDVVLRCRR